MKKFLALALTLIVLAVSASAAEISFEILSDAEQNYLVDINGSENADGRFFDGEMYVVYKFTFDPEDTHAEIILPLASGYEVFVSTDYDENALDGTWTSVLKQQLPTDDEHWWSPMLEPIELTPYLKDCKNNTIYVKVGDYTPEDGLGGFLYTVVAFEGNTLGEVGSPVIFKSWKFVPETQAPATEAPATQAPAADAPAQAPATAPAPQTTDITAIVALMAVAAAGVVAISKKR